MPRGRGGLRRSLLLDYFCFFLVSLLFGLLGSGIFGSGIYGFFFLLYFQEAWFEVAADNNAKVEVRYLATDAGKLKMFETTHICENSQA